MNLTIEKLRNAIRKLNYKWFNDAPNIIGIRSALQVPDIQPCKNRSGSINMGIKVVMENLWLKMVKQVETQTMH